MTDFFATVGGRPCSSVSVQMPWTGVWFASAELHEPAELPSAVTLVVGDTTFRGVVDPRRSGTFAGKSVVTILGGAGGWRRSIPARAHHNDGTIRASRLAVAAGREVGETLVVASALDGPVTGVDWPREADAASSVLRLLFGDAWWVGADGVTRVDRRSVVDVTGQTQILEYDPQLRRAEIGLDGRDLSVVFPGASMLDPVRLGATPFVVRDVEIEVAGSSVRAHALGGGEGTGLGEAIRNLVRDPARTYFGTWRYRVYRMSGDRVELQIVRRRAGLPDVLPVSMSPGVAGAWSELAAGAIVLVQFLEGDPSLPIVVGYTRRDNGSGGDEPGFIPVRTILDAQTLELGPTAVDVLVGEALGRLLRDGEKVVISGLTCSTGPVASGPGLVTIGLDPTMVAPGAPGTGFSRAKA